MDAANVKTPADLTQFLGEIQVEVKSIKQAGHDREVKIDRMAEDLQIAIQNTRRNAPRPEPRLQGEDAMIRAYIPRGQDSGVHMRYGPVSREFGGQKFESEQYGLFDDPEPKCAWQVELQKKVSTRNMARLIMKRPNTPRLDGEIYAHFDQAPKDMRDALDSEARAFYDGSTAGAEFIPDEFMTEVFKEFQIRRGVKDMFEEVPVTRETVLLPKITTGLRPYIKGKVDSDDYKYYTPSSLVTGQGSLTIPGLAVRCIVDDAASEDSAVAIIPTLNAEMGMALTDGWEDCAINGDTTATHEDEIASWNIASRWGASGLGGSGDHRRTWKGFRRIAVDRSATVDQSAAKTYAGFLTLKATMGTDAMADLACITSVKYLVGNMLGFAEVVTLDKLGPQATVITGQLASLAGVPIVPSEFMSDDLNASGLYDAITETKTGFCLVSRQAFKRYMRRNRVIEMDKEIRAGAIEIVATVREDFQTITGSSRKVSAFSYNL